MQAAERDSGLHELERRWRETNARVIRAERAYADLASRDPTDHRSLDEAWLVLWNAEQLQRDLDRQLDAAQP
jgi:hypothetical protein